MDQQMQLSLSPVPTKQTAGLAGRLLAANRKRTGVTGRYMGGKFPASSSTHQSTWVFVCIVPHCVCSRPRAVCVTATPRAR
jgi:hypothetical protein